jgi:hypothetical protein
VNVIYRQRGNGRAVQTMEFLFFYYLNFHLSIGSGALPCGFST